jgi:hypothetical protein
MAIEISASFVRMIEIVYNSFDVLAVEQIGTQCDWLDVLSVVLSCDQRRRIHCVKVSPIWRFGLKTKKILLNDLSYKIIMSMSEEYI